MKALFLLLSFLLPLFSFAQKNELKQWCNDLDGKINNAPSYYIAYQLTMVASKDLNEKESMKFQLFKSGNKALFKMGAILEMIQEGDDVLVVNHQEKLISTAKMNQSINNSVFNEFVALIDSATKVSKKQDQTFTTYEVSLPIKHKYSFVRITYKTNSKELVGLFALFNPIYKEPYYSLNVSYETINLKWKASEGFISMSKYITKTGNTYQLKKEWKGYVFNNTASPN